MKRESEGGKEERKHRATEETRVMKEGEQSVSECGREGGIAAHLKEI